MKNNKILIDKYKNDYIEKSRWSLKIKLIIKLFDFNEIVNQQYKICETTVKLYLILFLKNLQYSAENILDILVNEQSSKSTVLGYFFKLHIFNDVFFHDVLQKISNDINLKLDIENCPNYILYLKHKYHKCKICNNLTLRVYCSQKCMGKDIDKTKKSLENAYTESAKQHRIETCLKRYGTVNPLSNGSKVLDKIRKNNIEKFGGENPLNKNSPARKKAEQTMLEKYGVKHFNNMQKIIQTNLKKLGVEYATLKNFKNFDKLNKEYVEKHFIKNDRFFILEFLEFFNLSLAIAYRYKKKLGITIPNNLQEGTSKPQLELYDSITEINKLYNDRTIIAPLELDIVLPNIKLAIEYNGSYWHSLKDIPSNWHLTKTELCENKGFLLFHIFDYDDISIWKSMINYKLGNAEKIYARKCIAKTITNNTAKVFCDINHLQGGINAKVNYGLFYNDKLVAMMSFGKPRYNKHADWELLRFCQLKNTHVIGAAGKLLSMFRKQYSGSIISYANRRWSNGNLYKLLGFKFVKNTIPGFVYSKNGLVYSRILFQKHKLKNMKHYDPKFTADKILELEGYTKLYDCGNSVWFLS